MPSFLSSGSGFFCGLQRSCAYDDRNALLPQLPSGFQTDSTIGAGNERDFLSVAMVSISFRTDVIGVREDARDLCNKRGLKRETQGHPVAA